MPRKQSENELQKMVSGYGWGRHKYGDRRYCLVCHSLLPKSEKAPDYSVWPVYTWIECKESNSDGRWPWIEISEDGERKKQREFLLENGGWLFLMLARKKGRVSKDRERSSRSAYLIPFHAGWVDDIEPILIENNMRSIKKDPMRGNKPGGDEILAKWRLDWGNDGWEIPIGHDWWISLYRRLEKELNQVRSMLCPTYPK